MGRRIQPHSSTTTKLTSNMFNTFEMRPLGWIRESTSLSMVKWQKTLTFPIKGLPKGDTHTWMTMCSKSSFHVLRWRSSPYRNLPIYYCTTKTDMIHRSSYSCYLTSRYHLLWQQYKSPQWKCYSPYRIFQQNSLKRWV